MVKETKKKTYFTSLTAKKLRVPPGSHIKFQYALKSQLFSLQLFNMAERSKQLA